jgi:hypothetical protein
MCFSGCFCVDFVFPNIKFPDPLNILFNKNRPICVIDVSFDISFQLSSIKDAIKYAKPFIIGSLKCFCNIVVIFDIKYVFVKYHVPFFATYDNAFPNTGVTNPSIQLAAVPTKFNSLDRSVIILDISPERSQ